MQMMYLGGVDWMLMFGVQVTVTGVLTALAAPRAADLPELLLQVSGTHDHGGLPSSSSQLPICAWAGKSEKPAELLHLSRGPPMHKPVSLTAFPIHKLGSLFLHLLPHPH